MFLLTGLSALQDTVFVAKQGGSTGGSLQFYLSILAFLVSLGTLIVVATQLNFFIRQLRLNTLSKIIEANRILIRMGIEDTDLLYAMKPKDIIESKDKKEVKADRYYQLFLNHVEFIWQARELGLLNEWQWSGLDEDISYTFEKDHMKEHWKDVKEFYPEEFREYVDSLIQPQN